MMPKVMDMLQSVQQRTVEMRDADTAQRRVNPEDRVALMRDARLLAITMKQIEALGIPKAEVERVAKADPVGWKQLVGVRVPDRNIYTHTYVTKTLGVPEAEAEGFILSLQTNTDEMLDNLYRIQHSNSQ